MANTPAIIDDDQKHNELVKLLKRTDTAKPKQKDIDALRAALTQYPELWRAGGDVAKFAQQAILDGFSDRQLIKESIVAGLEVQRRALGVKEATPIEKILIEQVVICKLQNDLAQRGYANASNGAFTLPQADYWERRLSATQRRYLRAVETLARVRRLLRPSAVQVNIGAQQVNVMGEAAK